MNYVHNVTRGNNDMQWWEIILIIAGCIAVVTFVSLYSFFVLSSRISEEGRKQEQKLKKRSGNKNGNIRITRTKTE